MSAARDPAGALVAQIAAQRRAWVPLAPGKRMQLEAPSYWTARRLAGSMHVGDGDQAHEILGRLVVAWEGFTAAHFLGAGVGSEDPIEPTPQLVRYALSSQLQWTADLVLEALALEKRERAKFEAVAGTEAAPGN